MTLGSPYKIIYGVDSWGNICHQQNDVIPGVNENRTGLDLTSKRLVLNTIKRLNCLSADSNSERFANNTDSGETARNELSHLKPALFTFSLSK